MFVKKFKNHYINYIFCMVFRFRAYIIKTFFVRVVKGLWKNIIWIFIVMPYDLMFRNLVHIYIKA